MAIDAQSVAFASGDIVSMMVGINDTQRYFTAAQQEFYRGFVLEAAVKALSTGSVYPAAMTQTGSWIVREPDVRIPWPSQGVISATVGSTLTTQVSGTAVYIGTTYQDLAAAAGQAQVTIDGNVVGVFSSYAPGMTTALNTQAPAVIRFGGLTAGRHTVVVTLMSGIIYMEHITGSAAPLGTTLYLLTPSRTYQPADTEAPGPAIALGTIIKTTVSQLQADGYSVKLFDVYPLIGPGQVLPDEIHWTDATHEMIATDFEAIIGGAPPPPTYIPAYLCTNGTGYFGAKDMGCTINLQPL
jgi:hypothetical protein